MCSGRFSRVAVALSAIACLFSAGCIPYAYPKLSYIPGTELGPEVSDVRAFRVDGDSRRYLIGGVDAVEYSLTEITPRPDGTLPSQMHLSMDGGASWLLSPFESFLRERHATCLRLYRPGYQLVERKSWELTKPIQWQPALDWLSQEQALYRLLSPPDLGAIVLPRRRDEDLPLPPTMPGSWEAFEFAIAECERLEKCAPTPEGAARLRYLGQKLSERQFDAARGSKK
jgi:hypothetical protein